MLVVATERTKVCVSQGYGPRKLCGERSASKERNIAKALQSKMPYREADYIAQNLTDAHRSRFKHRDRPLTLDSGAVLGIFSAFTQIDVTTHALANAREVLTKMATDDLPKRAIRDHMNAVGILTKKMNQLAENSGAEDEGSTSQGCDDAKGLVDRELIPYLARAVAKEKHPEQEAKIREFMGRMRALTARREGIE